MAAFYVNNETDLSDALSSESSDIRIFLSASFLLDEGLVIPQGKTVSIASNGNGSYILRRAQGNTLSFIYVSEGSSLTLSDVTLDGNKLPSSGPLISNYGDVTLKSGSILENNVNYYNGGGAVYTGTGATLHIKGAKIMNNIAPIGGGIYGYKSETEMDGGEISYNIATDEGGGGVALANAVFRFRGGSINNNTASADSGRGGGILAEYNSTVEMSCGYVTTNSAPLGGGVYNDTGSTFTLSGGIITSNTAQAGAGAYNTTDAIFIVSGGSVTANQAETGGGIDNEGGATVSISAGSVSSNSATDGGGIYNGDASYIYMTGGSVSENTARDGGGGIYNDNGTLQMSGGQIDSNQAKNGGGIYTDGYNSLVNIAAGYVCNNTASQDGGGMAVGVIGYDQAILGSGAVFCNNMAMDGGGVYVECDSGFDMLKVEAGMTFTGNTANVAYALDPYLETTHSLQILTNKFSNGFTYGYNNYDITAGCNADMAAILVVSPRKCYTVFNGDEKVALVRADSCGRLVIPFDTCNIPDFVYYDFFAGSNVSALSHDCYAFTLVVMNEGRIYKTVRTL